MKNLKEKIDQDPYLNFLGISLDVLDEGFAECSVVVRENMLNFLGVPHGGMIFSLADAALSAASNNDHSPAYATNVSGSFLSKVKPGDKIVSRSTRIHETFRTALYKIDVFHADKLIATFHGSVQRKHS